MGVHLRHASPEDAGPAGAICYEAFKTFAEQHRFPPDFPTPDVAVDLITYMLSRPDIYSVIAEADGRLVGSNFLWETGAVAGVGPITIDPKAQNDAIGRQLMTAVLARARQQGIGAVRLVQAAYHGRSLALYTKLGFVPREPLAVLQGEALRQSVEGHRVRVATDADMQAANALCHRVHGHNRAGELQEALRQGTALWSSTTAGSRAMRPASAFSVMPSARPRRTSRRSSLRPKPFRDLAFWRQCAILICSAGAWSKVRGWCSQ
jgi:GNAT superfamily N-acetyltransferase